MSEILDRAIESMAQVDNQKANVQIAQDVFLEYLGLHKAHDRFDLYDLIIDCRQRLYSVTFEQCKEALFNLTRARVVHTGTVPNQYILIKGSKN